MSAEGAIIREKTKSDYVEEANNLASLLKDMDINESEVQKDYGSWGSSVNTHQVYLVSSRWFQIWREKTSFELIEDGITLEENHIGEEELPQLNSDLVDVDVDLESENYLQYDDSTFDFLNTVAKSPLIENENFVYVTKAVWDFIKEQYPNAIELKRVAYTEYSMNKFEVNLTRVNLRFVPNEKLEVLSDDPKDILKEYKTLLSKRMKVEEFKDMLIPTIYDVLPANMRPHKIKPTHIALYLVDSDVSFEALRKGVNSFLSKKTKYAVVKNIPVDCTLLEDDKLLSEYSSEICQNSDLIILVKSYRDFKFKPKREDPESDSDDNDYNYYSGNRRSSWDRIMKPKTQEYKGYPEKTEDSVCGESGLRNLGNTCFMNSALQCLSHTTDLVKYFLDKEWKVDKNEDNPLGSKGKLVDAFAELIFQLWNGKKGVVSPSRFKYEMGNFQNMFEGMSQHDSQEFLSHLLDGLHEDLNLIQKKPYTEGVEGSLEDDDKVTARKSWVNFLKRNYSNIMKLFYGQFRSETRCPDCGKTVITFDPYQLISLAVPKKITKTVACYFISANQNKVAKKVKFRVSYVSSEDRTMREIIEAFAEENGGTADEYFFTFSGFTVYGMLLGDDYSLKKFIMKANDKSFRPRPFLFRMDKEEMANFKNPERITVMTLTRVQKKREFDHPSFTKFAFVDENTSFKELYFRLFKKHAHFHDFDGTGLSEYDSRDKDEPLPEVDYKDLFERYFLNGTDAQQFFTLVIEEDGEEIPIPISEEKTMAELLSSKSYNPKNRTLKLVFDVKYAGTKEVRVNLMKKCQTDHNYIKLEHKGSSGKNGVDLQILLQKFSEPEQLDEQNTWYCSNCKEHVRALKKIQIYKVPKHLVIHMKKLKQGSSLGYGYSYTKEEPHNVDFPLTGLDMTDHVINSEPLGDYDIKKEEFMDENNQVLEGREIKVEVQGGKKLIYDCYGVINHYGSSYFGHYTAYVRRGKQGWFCADDSSFNRHPAAGVVTEAAYVIFYKLREGDDPSNPFAEEQKTIFDNGDGAQEDGSKDEMETGMSIEYPKAY